MQKTADARRAVVERVTQLRALYDHVGAGVIEFDLVADRLIRVNRAFCQMVGYSEAELLGTFDRSVLTFADDRADEAERLANLRDKGEPYVRERRYRRSDGSVLWVHLSIAASMFGTDGRPVRLVSVVQDITERRAAEAALQASEEILRLSLDIGQIGSYRRDLVADVIHCDAQTRRMLGYPPGDAPIPNALTRAMIDPEDVPRIVEQLDREFAEQRPVISLQYRIHHPVNGIRHIETRSQIEYDCTGRPLATLGVAIDVTSRCVAEGQAVHLAHHDPLTGLPNRTLFRQRLDAALARAERGEGFALFCLDLDYFKDINDTLGHPVGDALLQAVTERLRAAVRPTDTVARLGGDEFAIIQGGIDVSGDATSLVERLLPDLAKPFDLGGHHVVISASVGIATAPQDGIDRDTLLRSADMALYGAKGAGRGRYQFFEPEMDARAQARRAIELDLRRAVDDEAFELFYQPVVRISSGQVSGFEALLRWRHPNRGLVMPDHFIPVAEATAMIVPIGAWVLRRACAEAAGWPSDMRVAVNLSAVQFGSRTLVADVQSALDLSGLDPARLELEITETVLLLDTEATVATLHRLKALGIAITMDDFGTGYSSLSYLQRFPFDRVKIDRLFIGDLGSSRRSAAIVGAVIGLCASLEMETTAEGVESASQLAALADIGCHEAQGYYFSPPRPADEVASMIAQIESIRA